MKQKTRWIDLSAQGVYLGSIKLADGVERLALLDMRDVIPPESLKEIGFLPFQGSPRFEAGIYCLRGDEGLRPSRIAKALGIDRCPVVEVETDEIDRVFREKCLQKFQANLDSATHRADLLGHNAEGNPVYQTPAGRFVRASKTMAVSETAPEGRAMAKGLFLRSEGDADLRLCADALVRRVLEGARLQWPDLERLGRVVFGKGVGDGDLHRLQEAVEASAYRAFGTRVAAGPNEAGFKLACDLYYGLPAARTRTSESVFLQQYSTPLPMSLVAQRLLMGDDDMRGRSVIEPTAGNGGLVNLVPRSAKVYALELDRQRLAALRELPGVISELGDATEVPLRARFGEPDGFDYSIANPPFGSMEEAHSFDKLPNVRRLDHYIALKTLAARKDEGRSVLIVGADSAQSDGTIKGGAKHFLAYVHDHYEVLGCVELDGRLYMRNSAGYNVRLLVVGDKLAKAREIELDDKLTVLTTYEELWGWSERLVAGYEARAARDHAAKPEPEVGDVVFVRGGEYDGTVRTLLGKTADGLGFWVTDGRNGRIAVPGVEFRRSDAQPQVGERVRFTAFDGGQAPSVGVVEGLVADVAITSDGNMRYRIRTDVPAPQGDGNVETVVYSHQGRMEIVAPSQEAVADAAGLGAGVAPITDPGSLQEMAVVRDAEGQLYIVTYGRFDRLGGQPFTPGQRPEMSHEAQERFDVSEDRRNPELRAGPVYDTGLRYEGDWENVAKYEAARRGAGLATVGAAGDQAEAALAQYEGFTRLANGNLVANRAIDYGELNVDRLGELLRTLQPGLHDAEELKDYLWMLLYDPQGANEKGFMQEVVTGGVSTLVPRNKFWLSSIAERIAMLGGDPMELTNNPLVGTAGAAVESTKTETAVEVEATIDAAAVLPPVGPSLALEDALPSVVPMAPVAVKREPWELSSDEWGAARNRLREQAAVVGGSRPGGRQAELIGQMEALTFGVAAWYHGRAQAGDAKAAAWVLERASVTHRDVIEKALADKLPVPPAVVGEYPELVAKPAPQRRVNEFQTPYQAASQVGAASTMIPINMAGATYAALNDLESRHGPVDEFVARRLRLGKAELGGLFSPEQVDALALAIQSVEGGRGIINADMTGIGKGRFMAGMMRYAKVNGRRPIFLTIKPELFTDIFRDIEDIGSRDLFKKLFIFNEGVHVMRYGTEDQVLYKATSPQERRATLEAKRLDDDVDMVLATYSQFQRAATKNLKSQLLTELSRDNAMLLLDESHVASGASNIADTVGEAVANVEGVVYASATPLKGVTNFAIYSKVLPASVDLKSLPDTLRVGGEALQEAISANMARDGVLIRRESDFSKLTFETRLPSPERVERNTALANDFADVLGSLSFLAGDVAKMVGKLNKEYEKDWEKIPVQDRSGARMRASAMHFGSRLYALNRQFLLGIKIEDAVEAALAALEDFRKPVIGVENTGEALLRQVLARRAGVGAMEAELQDIDERSGALTDQDKRRREELVDQIGRALRNVRLEEPPQFRELLEIMLDRIGEIKTQGRYGEVSTVRPDSEEYLEAEASLRDRIRAFPDLPLTPLDVVRHELGRRGFPVTEVSGRTASLTYGEDGWSAQFHPKGDAVASVAGFQNGKFDAIIITRSGSTGISLHATDRFEDSDTRQREFVVLQKASNIAEFLQWLGRVNRKDQVIEPKFTLVESGLPAECRVGMMHNAKLRKLSANTTSNRENANSAGEDLDLLNEVGERVALEWLFENPDVASHLDISLPVDDDEDLTRFSQDCPYVNKLLGRLAMCDVPKQQEILDTLTRRFTDRVEELEQQGINPFKVKVYEWGAKVIHEEELQSGVLRPTGSTFDDAIKIVTVQFEQEVHPIRAEKLLAMVKAGMESYRANAPVDAEGSLAKYNAALRQFSEEALRKMLPAKLRESQLSVSELLRVNELPAVATARDKQTYLFQNLGHFKPGASFDYNDLFSGEVRGIVTAVDFPTNREDMFLLSKYTLRAVFPGDDHPRELSLATLFNQGHSLANAAHRSIELERMERLSAVREKVMMTLKPFDAAPDGKIKRQAHLLRGNIFRACELASQQKLGAPILFTDTEGNRQRAVLLKDRITPEQVKSLPIGLDAEDMAAYAAEFLRPGHPRRTGAVMYGDLRIFDNSVKDMKKGDGVMLEVLNGGREFRLSVPGTKLRAGSLLTDGSIFDIGEKTPKGSLRLRLSGTKAYMSVDVPRETLLPLMQRLQQGRHVGKLYLPEPDQEVLQRLKARYAKEMEGRQEHGRTARECEVA